MVKWNGPFRSDRSNREKWSTSKEEELIRDRIVVGLQDVKLSEKLQMDSSLTLQSATNKERQNESVKKRQEIPRRGVSPATPEIEGKRD